MITISIGNQKGGVAKSTTSQNLAAALKEIGYRTLILDNDPQCNTTSTYCDGALPEKNMKDVFDGKASLSDIIIETRHADIAPCSKELAGQELVYASKSSKMLTIYRELNKISDKYDYVIIDTPPNLGFFLASALIASNGVVITADADIYAMDGVSAFLDTIAEAGETRASMGEDELEIYGVLYTKFDSRYKQDNEVKNELAGVTKGLGLEVFDTAIRFCKQIQNAQTQHETIFSYRPNCIGALDYVKFTEEIIKKSSKRKSKA